MERHEAATEREDRRFARVMALLVNIHRDPKKSGPKSEDDFMPKKRQPMSAGGLKSRLMDMATAREIERKRHYGN